MGACLACAERAPFALALSVFAERGFVMGVVAVVCLQFVVLGLSFLIPNYAQLVMGAGETEAGSILLPGCVAAAQLGAADMAVATMAGTREAYLVLVVVAIAPLAAMAWVTRPSGAGVSGK